MSSYSGIQNTAITGLFLSTIALFIRLLVKWVSVPGTTADDCEHPYVPINWFNQLTMNRQCGSGLGGFLRGDPNLRSCH